LEFDQEKRDKYHRYLAHIFTEQDMHINYELVFLMRTAKVSVNFKYTLFAVTFIADTVPAIRCQPFLFFLVTS
jgi:hypothetical protein